MAMLAVPSEQYRKRFLKIGRNSDMARLVGLYLGCGSANSHCTGKQGLVGTWTFASAQDALNAPFYELRLFFV